MRDDFGVLILTHGRADNVITYKALQKCGYTGKTYIVIDDEDEDEPKYRSLYGDKVVQFNKQWYCDHIDTMDNFNEHRCIIYARNASFDIAEKLGLKYFCELDDDYSTFCYRFEKGGKLRELLMQDLDKIFELMIDFLDASGAITVCMAQNGDFIGGVNGGRAKKGILRKAMNSFVCSVDKRFEFTGTQNEDVNTYTTLGSRGKLLFTLTAISLHQEQTQRSDGGMSGLYRSLGTYVKSFYTVMAMPSAVHVGEIGAKNHKRMHHNVAWEHCVPMILNQSCKKQGR